MEPAPLLLLLLLGSPWGCSGRPAVGLVLVPPEPVVRFGGSAQLNCSLACAGGTVQWKGLDTNVESITSFPTHSILHVSNATVATGGTKSCHGTCHGQRYQRTVNLKVYALPDALQLEATPRALEPGQPGSLRCSAGQVYPLPGLVLSWYRGDQALPEADFDATETEEELFNIVGGGSPSLRPARRARCARAALGAGGCILPPGICWRGRRLPAVMNPPRVPADPLSTGPAVAVGSTVSLLGLIVTGAVSRRLWKRFRARYELP
uniref:Ig-like domain-containing protein n=1 Tax=Otus sunia TaxID=257818 RepID=A0A8C8EBN8_9STRI